MNGESNGKPAKEPAGPARFSPIQLAIAGLAASLTVPLVLHWVRRRWVLTIGALAQIASALLFALGTKASLVAAQQKVFFVSGRELHEYHARQKTLERVAAIGSGARALDTAGQLVALGFESGEVVLGTRFGPQFETARLTAK